MIFLAPAVACLDVIKSSATPEIAPILADINALTTTVPDDSLFAKSVAIDSAALNKTFTAAPAPGSAAEIAPEAAPHAALLSASAWDWPPIRAPI